MPIFVHVIDTNGKYLWDGAMPCPPRDQDFITANNDKQRQIVLVKWKQNPEGNWHLHLTVTS